MKPWVLVLAVFSEGTGVVATATQVFKTARTKNKYGISVWKNALVGSACVGWLFYGVSERIWPVVVANALLLVLLSYFLYLLAQTNKRKQLLFVMFACGTVLGLVLLFLSRQAAGWVSFIYFVLALLPQLIKVVKEKRIDGLSFKAEAVWLASSVTTFLYALELRAYPLIMSGVVGVVYSMVVLGMLHKKHPRHKR
jgi:uncharacterized protein with PQ loop repeat